MSEYLNLFYPYDVFPEREGGYSIVFPDLPGCITQAETYAEISRMAEDARVLWIETECELGNEIPLPFRSTVR
jgi:antitoxin HicB